MSRSLPTRERELKHAGKGRTNQSTGRSPARERELQLHGLAHPPSRKRVALHAEISTCPRPVLSSIKNKTAMNNPEFPAGRKKFRFPVVLTDTARDLQNLSEKYCHLVQVCTIRDDQLTAIPPEISRFENLEELHIGGARIAACSPEIRHCKKLRRLVLSGGVTMTTIPAEIMLATSLEALRVYQIKEIPSEIGQLEHLRILGLQSNKITALPKEIGQLHNLQELNLGNNRITTLPAEIGALSNLHTLNLGENHLAALPETIGQLQSLRRLDLHINKLTALPAELGKLQSLQELALRNNGLETLPAAFANLKNLSYLTLSRNRFSRFPPELLELPQLEWLWLAYNQIKTLPAEIAQLQKLHDLDLQGNQLSLLPETIGQLQNLCELRLGENPLHRIPETLKELRLNKNRQGKEPLLIFGDNPISPHCTDTFRFIECDPRHVRNCWR